MSDKITQRECELCKSGLEDKIDSVIREVRVAAGVTVVLVGTFITILGALLAARIV